MTDTRILTPEEHATLLRRIQFGIGMQPLADQLSAHDDAFRAKLTEAERERDEARETLAKVEQENTRLIAEVERGRVIHIAALEQGQAHYAAAREQELRAEGAQQDAARLREEIDAFVEGYLALGTPLAEDNDAHDTLVTILKEARARFKGARAALTAPADTP